MILRKLIEGAMQHAGALAPGEPLQRRDIEVAQSRLDDVIDSWETDDFLIPWTKTQTISSFPGITLTWGVGGDIDAPRPKSIVNIWGEQGTLNWEIESRLFADMVGIQIQNKGTSSIYPSFYSYSSEEPLGKLLFDSKPDSTVNLTVIYRPLLSSMIQFDFDTTLSTDIPIATGYATLVRMALAREIYPSMYGGRSQPREMEEKYIEEKTRMRARNFSRQSGNVESDYPSTSTSSRI